MTLEKYLAQHQRLRIHIRHYFEATNIIEITFYLGYISAYLWRSVEMQEMTAREETKLSKDIKARKERGTKRKGVIK